MTKKLLFLTALCFNALCDAQAQTRLTLDLTKGVKVSPKLYGLMTEEINHSYDGGLYAELIRNRVFKDSPTQLEAWSAVQDGETKASIQLVGADPANVPFEQERNAINTALNTCLKLTVSDIKDGRAGIANSGFWGIPVTPSTTYHCSFYIKTGTVNYRPNVATPAPAVTEDGPGIINISLESSDGKKTYAKGTINLAKSSFWKKHELTITTVAGIKPTADARFVISTNRTGTYYFNLVSLFPPL